VATGSRAGHVAVRSGSWGSTHGRLQCTRRSSLASIGPRRTITSGCRRGAIDLVAGVACQCGGSATATSGARPETFMGVAPFAIRHCCEGCLARVQCAGLVGGVVCGASVTASGSSARECLVGALLLAVCVVTLACGLVVSNENKLGVRAAEAAYRVHGGGTTVRSRHLLSRSRGT